MDEKSINAVLKDIRREHELTQEELAKKMGVSRDTVARIDAELQNVKFDYLVKFAGALKMSVSDIMERFEKGPEFVYLLRAANWSNFSTDIRLRYEKWYRRMEKDTARISLPVLREIPIRADQNDRVGTIEEQAIAKAKWLRKKWNLGCSPIADPVELVESLGFFIVGMDLGNTALFGITGKKKGNDIPGIVINTNRNISIERQRYSVIHELGHIVEHGKQFDAVPNTSGRGRNKDVRDKFADAFAGEFLVPGDELKRLYNKVYIPNFDNKVIYLKHHFKVSYECILFRLFKTGLLQMDQTAFGAFLGKKRNAFGFQEPMPMKTPLVFSQEKQLCEMIRRETAEMKSADHTSSSSLRISLA